MTDLVILTTSLINKSDDIINTVSVSINTCPNLNTRVLPRVTDMKSCITAISSEALIFNDRIVDKIILMDNYIDVEYIYLYLYLLYSVPIFCMIVSLLLHYYKLKRPLQGALCCNSIWYVLMITISSMLMFTLLSLSKFCISPIEEITKIFPFSKKYSSSSRINMNDFIPYISSCEGINPA
jgi:hypothetical protein